MVFGAVTKHLSWQPLILATFLVGIFISGCNKNEASDTPVSPSAAFKNASPEPGGVVGGAPADPAKELEQLQNEKKAAQGQ